MSDCKRCASTIAAMVTDVSSTGPPTISKKRKSTTPSDMQQHHHLPNSHCEFPDVTVSPETSVNSAGTVVSGDSSSDHSPLSSCSSSHVTALLDLEVQTKGFETADSSNRNFKSFSLLSEFSGDSEESMFTKKHSAGLSEPQNMKKTVPMAEIEEFFAIPERHEQKRFAEKYNFDIVRDMPLEGRYQWVRLH